MQVISKPTKVALIQMRAVCKCLLYEACETFWREGLKWLLRLLSGRKASENCLILRHRVQFFSRCLTIRLTKLGPNKENLQAAQG